MSDEIKRGDRRLFGTYWSEAGPIRIPLDWYVWDGDGWIMEGSPADDDLKREMGQKPVDR